MSVLAFLNVGGGHVLGKAVAQGPQGIPRGVWVQDGLQTHTPRWTEGSYTQTPCTHVAWSVQACALENMNVRTKPRPGAHPRARCIDKPVCKHVSLKDSCICRHRYGTQV